MASKPSSSKSKSRTCMCSPTTHPGSFRCSMHRALHVSSSARPGTHFRRLSTRWDFGKPASLKAVLLQIIKPSSRDLRRRRNFQPTPSRFCVLNGNGGGVAVS